MSVEVKIPAVGESITSGLLSSWSKQDGDSVKAGEALLTLETDKVSSEITAEKSRHSAHQSARGPGGENRRGGRYHRGVFGRAGFGACSRSCRPGACSGGGSAFFTAGPNARARTHVPSRSGPCGTGAGTRPGDYKSRAGRCARSDTAHTCCCNFEPAGRQRPHDPPAPLTPAPQDCCAARHGAADGRHSHDLQ